MSSNLQNVIFCKLCDFCAFTPKVVISHLASHDIHIIFCGIDFCQDSYTSLGGFKNHLRLCHSNFYPVIKGQILLDDSLFCFKFQKPFNQSQPPLENNVDLTHANDHIILENINVDREPGLEEVQSPTHSEDLSNDLIKHKFLEILVKNGCNQNIQFKSLKNIADSLSEFFLDLSVKNKLNYDTVHLLCSSIYNSDHFDNNLETNFDAVFQEVINILSIPPLLL